MAEAISAAVREVRARVEARLGALTETHRFVLDAVDNPRFLEGSPEQGARWLTYAWRGHTVREHFERAHPNDIELGLEGAPAPGIERDGWLWGYRWCSTEAGG